MSKIFYIMGKSASGKDTVFKELQKKMPELKTVVLYTTRPIRNKEKEGVEYFFVDEKKLQEFRENDQIIECREYDTVNGKWNYFTADDGQINIDQDDYIMIGTLDSYEKMKKYFGKEVMVPVYIEVEDGDRLSRALQREKLQKNPNYEELCRRFLADSKDFSEENLRKSEIKQRFLNEDIEKCTEQIILYIHEKL